MACLRSALFVLTTTAVHVASEHVDHDAMALLQASVEEKSLKRSATPETEPAQAYNMKDPLECANEKVEPLLQASKVEIASTVEKASVSLIDASSSDPPGANAFKATLHFMVVLLIVDGLRRWHLQQQRQTPESAWIDMVNAAKSGNAKHFHAALLNKPKVMQADTWGCTPLHFAALGGSVDIVSTLLNEGVEIDALDGSDETPLHVAARAGHSSICEMLLKAGAKAGGAHGLADEDVPPLLLSQLVQKVFVPGEATGEWMEDED